MVWEMNFYFQLLCVYVLTFGGKKLEEHGLPRPLPMLRPSLKRGYKIIAEYALLDLHCIQV